MLLHNRSLKDMLVPKSSICYITTRGEIHDGDVISVISPVFSSMDYSSRAVHLSESFDAVFRTGKESVVITDDNNEAYLNSTDQDINNLYVTMEIGL